MSETPTPRTDALGEYPESWLIRHPEVLKHRLLCFSLETDLQHLARVAGEALKDALITINQLADQQATPDDFWIEEVAKLRAALSEIQRLKEQTK